MITKFKTYELVKFEDIFSKGYNNLYYTKTDFMKMLNQVLDYYYDEFGIEFLGYGAEGDAFKVKSKDSTKVLKITKEKREASAIEKVRKIHINGLVDYYDVRRIIDVDDIYFELYVIIMENAEKLNEIEQSVWNFLRGYFFDLRKFKKSNYLIVPGDKINYDEFLEINNIDRLNSIYEKYIQNRDVEKIYSITNDINYKLMNSDEAYKILLNFYEDFCTLVKDAVKYKLNMGDFHIDNAGKDQNDHLIFYDVLIGKKKTNLTLKPIEIKL